MASPGRWRRRAAKARALLPEMGVPGILEYLLARIGVRRGKEFVLHTRQALHPLHLRPGTSDLEVYHQIFVARQYAPLRGLDRPGLVIDCGAYVGCSAAYFLSRSPGAQLIAVEPDPDNVAWLRTNLAPYGTRAEVVHGAVWPAEVPLQVEHGTYGDGRAWSRQVTPAVGAAPTVPGVEIGALLARSGHERISLLKMDIEGAEAMIFAAAPPWLDRVDAIAIELHDDTRFGPATAPFLAAIAPHGFEVTRSGELTLCQRR